MAEVINYFGSNPQVPKEFSASENDESFDNKGDEQLTLGADFEAAAHTVDAIPTDFDRLNVPRGAWVEIDLSAIDFNVRQARKAIGLHKQLMAVVKADAYGHGAVRVAQTALAAGADRLAVATVQEGVELREAGITAPILLLAQPPERTIPYLITHHITPAVCTAEFALKLGEAADIRGEVAPFHLAVNTGMNRIGVYYLDVVDFIHQIDFHRGLKYEGTFTHFATADCTGDIDFRMQLERFNEALKLLEDAGINPGIRHCANSVSIFRYPEAHFDMVRLGICLYGLSSSPETRGLVELKPAMQVKAEISNLIEDPQFGEGVSYGMNYRVANQIQIATVPLGYADGVRRCLQDRMRVIWNGRFVNQIGNICMDQMMIEIPKAHSLRGQTGSAEIGDEVVLVGRQGNCLITVDDMADACGTINHEITCLFGLRLPKIYV